MSEEEYAYVKCANCGADLVLRSMLGKIYVWRFGRKYGGDTKCHKCGHSIRDRRDGS